MTSPSNVSDADVRILRHDQPDAAIAQNFGARLLAEITHLPTGAASDRIDAVDVPPGGRIAECPAGSAALLLHVVMGEVRLSWRNESAHTAIASAGDTALVPAGVAFQAFNASPVEALQFIVVRGD